MVVKRTFATKLEPADAFALTDELLRPRGFTIDKGSHHRAQKWRRGAAPGKKSKNLFTAPQDIEVEFDRGRVNVAAACATTGRAIVLAQRMMTAYAEAVEHLMTQGMQPKAAGKGPQRAESSIRFAMFRRSLAVCTVLLAVLVGGGYAVTHPKEVPLPTKWFSFSSSAVKGQAQSGSKQGKSTPVVVVRRGSAQTNATPSSSNP